MTVTSLFPVVERSLPRIAYHERLNPQQLAVVSSGPGPALVIAGAGSGKTHTLVHRVAWLIEHGIEPEQILLLTFTRKASEEMLKRVGNLLGQDNLRVQGGTFHSVANNLLRLYGHHLGIPSSFSILDQDEAQDLIDLLRSKRLLTQKELKFPKKGLLNYLFSQAVNTRTPLADLVQGKDDTVRGHLPMIEQLFDDYTAAKRDQGLMDYDDLLVLLHQLLTESPEVRSILIDSYRHILVDEYQDTNRLQAEIVQLLTNEDSNVMAVGDDGQSIYRFRGADIQNILTFTELFPTAQIYRLEENYRSTQPILSLANAILQQAPQKYPKKLFTNKTQGRTPLLVKVPSPPAQAALIADLTREYLKRGIKPQEIAVLFRSSHLTYDLEMELSRRQITFEKRGGQRLTDTAHVKDLASYLKVIHNPKDSPAWRRLLMLQPHIGPKTSQQLTELLTTNCVHPLATLRHTPTTNPIPLRALATVLEDLMEPNRTIAEQITRAYGHYQALLTNRFENAEKRAKDLEQLIAISQRYTSLETFLADLAIDPPDPHATAAAEAHKPADRVVLSTIHSAKGLEWEVVFILWALDGKFPSIQNWLNPEELEEERRLLYVAITRAKTILTITYPSPIKDPQYSRVFSEPCRFLEPIGPELLKRQNTH